MGHISIAVYKPKPGMQEQLEEITRKHHSILTEQGLVTDRKPIVMKAKDGSIIEVFEWKGQDAIDAAHENEAVMQLWEEYGQACEYIPIAEIEEAQSIFSGFTPL